MCIYIAGQNHFRSTSNSTCNRQLANYNTTHMLLLYLPICHCEHTAYSITFEHRIRCMCWLRFSAALPFSLLLSLLPIQINVYWLTPRTGGHTVDLLASCTRATGGLCLSNVLSSKPLLSIKPCAMFVLTLSKFRVLHARVSTLKIMPCLPCHREETWRWMLGFIRKTSV